MQRFIFYICFLWILIIASAVLHSCANMAAPTGGAYDVDPPKVVRPNPPFNSLNVNRGLIEIQFDENIKIEKPNEKVIITPPQQSMPVIKAVGRKAVVELNDELLPNTTYVIDFTDAIVDNNESNPLENFVYSFSTGDQLDTLAVSGTVLTADNLEPVTGIHVGMHSNLNDTAFTNTAFERISRTDSRGHFTIRGMSAGEYKIYALDDQNRDYKYDNPQEAIAFLDSIVIPSTMPSTRQDTIYIDSVTIDTVKAVDYTRFLPDDLLLRSFVSDFQRKYLQKHERPEQHKLSIFFASPTGAPMLALLNPPVSGNNWYIQERSISNDSITLWITDSLIYGQDSIRMRINYLRTDSLNKDYMATDTLNFNIRRAARERRSRDSDKEEPTRFLGISTNIQSSFDVYQIVRLEFEQPIMHFDSSFVKLSREVDSVYTPLTYRFSVDSLNPRKYTLRHRWEPGGKYRLAIDSASFVSHYGLWNNTLDQSFTVKTLDQYGNLLFSISGLPEGKTAYVELLDKSDKPFRKTLVKNNEALFMDLNPGTVYARLFIDENGDGEWTTGNFGEKRQPEEVYYYPRAHEIRAYTDHEESWDITAIPVIKQKPLDITKNKPEEKKERNPSQERDQQTQNQQRSLF